MTEEREKKVAWKTNAKGKGYRWTLQRTIAACLARVPLTTSGVGSLMSLKHGMSNPTTERFLKEMRASGALEQFLEAEKGYFWRTTDKGVVVYLGHRKAIPAQVAQELLFLVSANESEGSHNGT